MFWRLMLYLVLIFGAIAFSLPFFWMVRTSVMPSNQIYVFPPEWIPTELQLGNWVEFWTDLPFPTFYKNTLFYVVARTLIVTLSSSLVAYGFARLRFPGRNILFMLCLSTMMLPPQVTLIPQYLIFSRLGWVNTYYPLIVPGVFGVAFHIFLLRQYYSTIPLEMDDSAKIDGCGFFGIYWRIILPMSLPALGVVAVMNITFAWNEFFGPLIYLNQMSKYPLSLGLSLMKGEGVTLDMQLLMAATTASLLPLLVLFFLAQKYFIQGIVVTGVKG
jgi:ABC-type glycerol-3-phosphate transport system permease component